MKFSLVWRRSVAAEPVAVIVEARASSCVLMYVGELVQRGVIAAGVRDVALPQRKEQPDASVGA
jgi:hypothetical protein